MRLKVFNTCLGLLCCICAAAQDSSALKPARRRPGFKTEDTTSLNKFTVRQKTPDFGLSRLHAIENMGIYEGKKTEVIIPEQLVANLATNNARQVFSRIAGLNIFENDGAGLQLSIGGRGLDPNRSSNFNVRQNGYDISADALGYPESYYTPPVEAVGKIQIVRGAASLQYGTQFGGLVNFIMKQPVKYRKMELQFRQSIGSFGFYNAFSSVSGTHKKLSYYGFFQYKRMNGWRSNSGLESFSTYMHLNYQFSKRTKMGIEYTNLDYLAKQPGGLSDAMFAENPRQSNRQRNWFDVNWNLMALHLNHEFRNKAEFNIRLFGLLAHRYAVGFRPNRVATTDMNGERDLMKGEFRNTGMEARYLKRHKLLGKSMAFLGGTRYYRGYNRSMQGLGSSGSDADFSFVKHPYAIANDYEFPNDNLALFAENIVYLSARFSITPGLRYEYIHTRADGYYQTVQYDLAGNVINALRTDEKRADDRGFLLGGLGLSYKPGKQTELYGNMSQNYRSITFSDMRISNPSQVIDPDLQDERGFSFDLGLRSNGTRLYTYDISAFVLNYSNRIGEVQSYDASNRVLRLRTNIGQAVMSGLETYAEADVLQLLMPRSRRISGVTFVNLALIHSEYKSGLRPGIAGNKVEFVPGMNLKSGLRIGSKNLKFSLQFTRLSEQFTDASNAVEGGVSSVVGIIPAYNVWDAGIAYQYRRLKVEISSNNLNNRMYFTRRATGYPGPGIIPSDGRSLFLTLGYRI